MLGQPLNFIEAMRCDIIGDLVDDTMETGRHDVLQQKRAPSSPYPFVCEPSARYLEKQEQSRIEQN
jgi:hypothetical protein